MSEGRSSQRTRTGCDAFHLGGHAEKIIPHRVAGIAGCQRGQTGLKTLEFLKMCGYSAALAIAGGRQGVYILKKHLDVP
jgi:hypothetical protein